MIITFFTIRILGRLTRKPAGNVTYPESNTAMCLLQVFVPLITMLSYCMFLYCPDLHSRLCWTHCIVCGVAIAHI